eukprot:TRINITY_DN9326_c0_g1_i1.p1 TRINITY_DN9326_c0_g1~~TRINITY_DN9326_c0_g1_i1.p1  ORF type:complete len:240 (-),score=79.45 TRINITY_DN9326_c0_g1_i1:70-789(-)
MPPKGKATSGTKRAPPSNPTPEVAAQKAAARKEKLKAEEAKFKALATKRQENARKQSEKRATEVEARRKAKEAKAPKEGAKAQPTTLADRKLQAHRTTVGAVRKALQAASATKKGTNVSSRKVRTSATFKKPKTLRLPKAPKYPRRAVNKPGSLDQFDVLQHPLTTESAMKRIEESNTLVFIVHKRANKQQIAVAVQKLYDVKAASVNTMFQSNGLKKAYVKLVQDSEALDVANKIGII